MITTVMFDLDGVLIDAQEWHYEALNKALFDICGILISREDHTTTFDGLPTKVKLDILFKKGLVQKDQFDSIFKLKQHYTLLQIRNYCAPDPIRIEIMNALHDYKKACVTNSIAKTTYEMLVLSGLNYYLDYVQSNEATRYAKPNPAPYLNAMSAMGVNPIETLILEDSPHGIESAMLSGAKVLKVQYKTLRVETIMEAL